jgi:hypothetical protein
MAELEQGGTGMGVVGQGGAETQAYPNTNTTPSHTPQSTVSTIITVAKEAPEMPVISTVTHAVAAKPVQQDIRERMPILVNLKDMQWMKPSLRESFIAEQWLISFNYTKCAKAYELKFSKKLLPMTVKRWLARSRVQQFIKYKLEAQGIFNRYSGESGKKLWLKELLEYREGIRECGKKELVIMEMIGKYLGYMDSNESPGEGKYSMRAQTINFLQANGER